MLHSQPTFVIISLFCFQKYEKLAKAQLKKVTKIYAQEKKKSDEKEKKEVLKILEFLAVCIVSYMADLDVMTLHMNNQLKLQELFCVDETCTSCSFDE